MMFSQPFSTKILLVLFAGILLLSTGCANFRQQKTDCSRLVSSPQLGSRVVIPTQTDNQFVTVRLNGVSALCYERGGEMIIEVEAGLKLLRDTAVLAVRQDLEVPFLVAKIDADENVVGYESFGYRMTFADDINMLYPLTDFSVTVPPGGRLIISLVTQRIIL